MSEQTNSERAILDVREAVRVAKQHLLSLYEGETLRDFLLEEVQLSDDERYWLVTFGFDTTMPMDIPESSPALTALNRTPRAIPRFVRTYRVVRIDAQTGHFEEMRAYR